MLILLPLAALLDSNTADKKSKGIRALDKMEYLVIIWDNFCYFCLKHILCPRPEPSQQDGSDEGVTTYVSIEK